MNLVLIGYRGTGKSTLADRLHEELHLPVYHMDELLEERFGEKIASYVEKHGWDSFREEEQCLTEELSAMDAVIIDCGGGVVTSRPHRGTNWFRYKPAISHRQPIAY